MKKLFFFVLFALVFLGAKGYEAQYVLPTANAAVFCQVYTGSYTKIDSLSITLHPNLKKAGRYEFAPDGAPDMTINGKEYKGRVCATHDTIYWVVNLQAPEVGLTEELNVIDTRITFSVADIGFIDKTDNSVKKLSEFNDAAVKTPNFSQPITLSKYLVLHHQTDPARQYMYFYPTRASEPDKEYAFLGGEYGVTLEFENPKFATEKFTVDQYPNDEKRALYAHVFKEDGTLVKSYPLENKGNSSFYFFMTEQVTEPGKYYIIYDVAGRFRGYNTITSNAIAGIKINQLKTGPYVVSGSLVSRIFRAETNAETLNATVYSDDMPSEWTVDVTNAIVVWAKQSDAKPQLRCVVPGSKTITVDADVECQGSKIVISLEALKAKLVTENVTTSGNYTLYLDSPDTYFEGVNADNAIVSFVGQSNISTSFKVEMPLPAESVRLYVEHKEKQVEIADGETIAVRMGFAKENSNQQIYFKWTPSGESRYDVSANADATDDVSGFMLHDDNIEISEPGTLQYYTRHSNTVSGVKTIEFVKAQSPEPPASIEELEGEVRPDAGGTTYWNLNGVQVRGHLKPGLYIRKSASGKGEKVLIVE